MSSGMNGPGAALGTLPLSMLTDACPRKGSWHMGSSGCFNVVPHEAFRPSSPPEASTGLTPAMNGRSRALEALAQEGRGVSVWTPWTPLFSEAGSMLPIPCPLLDHPPAQTMEAHSRLYTASSLTTPGWLRSQPLHRSRLASRSSAEPSLLTQDKVDLILCGL